MSRSCSFNLIYRRIYNWSRISQKLDEAFSRTRKSIYSNGMPPNTIQAAQVLHAARNRKDGQASPDFETSRFHRLTGITANDLFDCIQFHEAAAFEPKLMGPSCDAVRNALRASIGWRTIALEVPCRSGSGERMPISILLLRFLFFVEIWCYSATPKKLSLFGMFHYTNR